MSDLMSLKTYIFRRCLMIIPTFLGITVIAFTIMHLAPGGPVRFHFGLTSGVDEELILALEHKMGLDKPIYEQYFIWLNQLLHGDLGYSFITSQSVIVMISARTLNTFKLMMTALILSIVIAIPLGVLSAVKRYSITDHLSMIGALFGVSIPGFWMGLMLILVFGLYLRWFPVSGTQSIGVTFSSPIDMFIDQLKHLVLPATVLALSGTALITRLVRSVMLEVLKEDYLMTARMKGLRERIVIYKHALRNALLPVITVVGLQLGTILGGAVVVETVFSWPGLGRLIVQAAFSRDYPVIMGVTVIVAFMVLISNLAADITYALVDPRIRY